MSFCTIIIAGSCSSWTENNISYWKYTKTRN